MISSEMSIFYSICMRVEYSNISLNYFQGKDSSDDEDLRDFPDDDQYDTEDSFIDDAELVRIISL